MIIDPKMSPFSPAIPTETLSASLPIIAPPSNDGVGSFQSVFSQAVEKVNQLQLEASSQQQAINSGQSDDLAGAMVASQQANISFSALLQVRNKLNSALDDILNTPL
ncbi:flagellar hook-basal body complex protein FliE [Tatumella sp. TA1]|uniref:flagellar hook-basal body complex protein FliE n=1 Tax=Rosenbergiella collisarenosi TaxID=1544695 RepID=UPI0008F8E2BC|nr:flagellar hook-basal body complex protein FliE [Rosenbergiella collisarenosi]MBT0721901.1 flagellar hook-basal body complex protein FliE [Rosenbergiella collisarenosi]QGX92722.1 flagellar hook-basal body complex protein FliE [Tatumella sp. TA1]